MRDKGIPRVFSFPCLAVYNAKLDISNSSFLQGLNLLAIRYILNKWEKLDSQRAGKQAKQHRPLINERVPELVDGEINREKYAFYADAKIILPRLANRVLQVRVLFLSQAQCEDEC